METDHVFLFYLFYIPIKILLAVVATPIALICLFATAGLSSAARGRNSYIDSVAEKTAGFYAFVFACLCAGVIFFQIFNFFDPALGRMKDYFIPSIPNAKYCEETRSLYNSIEWGNFEEETKCTEESVSKRREIKSEIYSVFDHCYNNQSRYSNRDICDVRRGYAITQAFKLLRESPDLDVNSVLTHPKVKALLEEAPKIKMEQKPIDFY